MDKGSYIHELCHFYYSLLNEFEIGDTELLDILKARVAQDFEEAGDEVDPIFYDECIRTFIGFVINRSPMIDMDITDLLVEYHLQREYNGRLIHGFADLIYWDTKSKVRVIRDHKTGGNPTTHSQHSTDTSFQLNTYGTLWYLETGEVAELETNFLHSQPPKNPVKTELFKTYRSKRSATFYENWWNYLKEIDNKQREPGTLQNLSSCGNCPYLPICRLELKGIDPWVVIRTRYESENTVQSENPDDSKEVNESNIPKLRWNVSVH